MRYLVEIEENNKVLFLDYAETKMEAIKIGQAKKRQNQRISIYKLPTDETQEV